MFSYEERIPHVAKFRSPLSMLKLTGLATSAHVRQSRLINQDDILKSISIGEEGRFYIDEESGEPVPDCVYAGLIERGYAGLVLGGRRGGLGVFKPHLHTYLPRSRDNL